MIRGLFGAFVLGLVVGAPSTRADGGAVAGFGAVNLSAINVQLKAKAELKAKHGPLDFTCRADGRGPLCLKDGKLATCELSYFVETPWPFPDLDGVFKKEPEVTGEKSQGKARQVSAFLNELMLMLVLQVLRDPVNNPILEFKDGKWRTRSGNKGPLVLDGTRVVLVEFDAVSRRLSVRRWKKLGQQEVTKKIAETAFSRIRLELSTKKGSASVTAEK